MDFGLKGKTALVCAASKGIGRACALELAREGVHVAICARGKEVLKKTSGEIREFGVRAVPVIADMTKADDRRRLFETAVEELGHIDILVNNAGGPPAGSFEDFSTQDYYGAVELSMISSIDMTYLAIPGMTSQGFGRVINITSIAVKQPIGGLILSNTARSGLVGFAKTVAADVAARGVTVNNVLPGVVFTDRMKALLGNDASVDVKPAGEGMTAQLIRDIPLGRMGRPEEIAALVVFLASERASFITGTSILADGGAFKGLF